MFSNGITQSTEHNSCWAASLQSWRTTSPHLKTGLDLCCRWDNKNNKKFFIASISRVHSAPLGGVTLLLDVLMKAALAIKSHRPGHLFSLSARISGGFAGTERSRASAKAHSGITSATFQSITASGRCFARLIWCIMALPMHTDIKAERVCCRAGFRWSNPSYYHIYLRIPTFMSDVTWLLSELYCTAYLSHYILLSE